MYFPKIKFTQNALMFFTAGIKFKVIWIVLKNSDRAREKQLEQRYVEQMFFNLVKNKQI